MFATGANNPIDLDAAEWTQFGVAITPGNRVFIGDYDSYGGLEGATGSRVYKGGEDGKATWFHYACWIASGKPKKWLGESPYTGSSWMYGKAPKFPLSKMKQGYPPGFHLTQIDMSKLKPMGPVQALTTGQTQKQQAASLDLIEKVMLEELGNVGFPFPYKVEKSNEYKSGDFRLHVSILYDTGAYKRHFTFSSSFQVGLISWAFGTPQGWYSGTRIQGEKGNVGAVLEIVGERMKTRLKTKR